MTKKKSLLITLATIFILCFTASIILSILSTDKTQTLNQFEPQNSVSNSQTILDPTNACYDCELKTFHDNFNCPSCNGKGKIIYKGHNILYMYYSNLGLNYANAYCTQCTKKEVIKSTLTIPMNPKINGPCEVECKDCHGTGVLNGGTITVAVTKTECTHCQDSQKQGKLECQDCKGNGHLKHDMEWFFFVEKCKDCGGINPINGNMHSEICNSNDCSNCNGTGFIDCEHCDNGWQYEVCTTCGGDHILD